MELQGTELPEIFTYSHRQTIAVHCCNNCGVYLVHDKSQIIMCCHMSSYGKSVLTKRLHTLFGYSSSIILRVSATTSASVVPFSSFSRAACAASSLPSMTLWIFRPIGHSGLGLA